MYLSKQGDAEKLNVTYFAIEAGSFLEPAVTEGVQFSGSDVENPILLDDDFALEETAYLCNDGSSSGNDAFLFEKRQRVSGYSGIYFDFCFEQSEFHMEYISS